VTEACLCTWLSWCLGMRAIQTLRHIDTETRIVELLPLLNAWQWALLLAVPPAIVALYFLKLRRQPLEVPSTYLWHKSIEDLHVNSLWQRIRQSLLLYLQLLMLGLVIFALLRPGWRSVKQIDERNILLIDNSASMSATDVSPSRLEEAKRRALAIIDNMQTEDERDQVKQQLGGQSSSLIDRGSQYKAMVISFSDTARVEQGWTNSPRELRRAIENIKPTNRPTAIDEALRVAAGLANPGGGLVNAGGGFKPVNQDQVIESQPAKLFIFSDGKFPPVQGFSLGSLTPVYVPVGRADAANVGIVSFSVRRNEERDNQLQAFGNIQNFGDEAVTAPVDLLLNGNPLDAKEVKVAAGETAGVAFSLGEIDSGILELRLSLEDAFADDNRAWAAVNSARRPKVLLVTPGNEALELALATPRAGELAEVAKAAPDVLQTKEHQRAAAAGAYDLVIYDRCKPVELPHANTLFIGQAPPPPESAAVSSVGNALRGVPGASDAVSADPPAGRWWSLGDPVVYPQIIDLDRSHPLMQWLDLSDVDIAEGRPITAPSGGTRLIDSNKGTMFAIAPREGFEDAVLGFDIYTANKDGETVANTTWPVRRSFPSFVYAVLEYLGGGQAAQAGQSVRPGQGVTIKSEISTEELTVKTPQGSALSAARGKDGAFHFSQTDELGPYEVLDEAKTLQRFTVNLFDELESNIRPAKEHTIQIGNTSVDAAAGMEPVRREMWKWLLLAALVVLLAEWYIYNRRVSV